MRTGRFRFHKRRRWFGPTIQILEVEVEVPGDMHSSYRVREWIPATGSDAHAIQTKLGGMAHGEVPLTRRRGGCP